MATAFDDEGDVPPLEDMSELVEQVKTMHCGYELKDEDALLTEKNKTSTLQKQSTKTNTMTFGGFQKGFLNSNTKKSASTEEERLPTIHPKQTESNSLRFPEVQRAMENSPVLQNKDWLTDKLIDKLEGRPDLLQKLADTRYSQALSLLRSNPDEGLKLIQGSSELQMFMKDLCGISGEHFTKMADETNLSKVDGKDAMPHPTASKEDEAKMSKILSDPATLDVLKDPWISKLVQNLKENPTEARRMLARSKPEVLPKIKKLIDAGILSYG